MKKNSAYDAALALIRQIGDDEYRATAIEGLILARVRRDIGRNDPAGELAMRLRREALT